MTDVAAATRRSPRHRTAPLSAEHDRQHNPAPLSPRPTASTPTPLARARPSRAQLGKTLHEGQGGSRGVAGARGRPDEGKAPDDKPPTPARGRGAVLLVRGARRRAKEGRTGLEGRDGPALLPSLLAHLATTPTFPLDCTSTHLAAPSPSHRFPPTDADSALSSSPKRPSSHDPAARLKKRKLRHAFLRSDLLLAGPGPASSSPAAATSDDDHLKRPRTASAHAPWWPSVSRSHGEGTPSPFAREGMPEAHECGSGEGWVVAQLVGRFGALGVVEDEDDEMERERERSRSRGRSRERRGGRGRARGRGGAREAGDTGGGPVRPGMPARAASSPAVFGASGLRTAYEAPAHQQEQEQEQEQQAELSGAALKKALLLNLRARMASDGGTSKGAEAGLRFKKWVVWNAWRTRTHEPHPQVVDAAPDASSVEPSSDYSLVGFADDSGDLLGGGGGGGAPDALGADDGELLLGDVDLFLLPLADDDALPSPPLEYTPHAEQSDGLVDERATVAPLSLLLVPPGPPSNDGDGDGDGDGDEPLSRSTPPVACPPMRRTASLPNVGEDDRRTQRGPRMATWEVARAPAAVVACEG